MLSPHFQVKITRMPGALDGVRVLDVTQVLAGPYCTMLLCDMGADVIKVEPPGGDSARRLGRTTGSDSAGYNAVNRGKRGIVLDLRSSEGLEVFRRLAATADVIVENARPGVMKNFELDYASLSPLNPGLIYASISGYGRTGPDAYKGGFDLVAQGVSGIMSITGEPGRPPVKSGIPVTDLGAGLFALVGVLAALVSRTRTGRGQMVDTSLLEAGVALSVWEATEYFAGEGVPAPMGSAHRFTAPYQAFRCADGYITLGTANDRLFRKLAAALDRADWLEDPHFATDAARVRHRAALAAQIEAITIDHPRAHWLAYFESLGIPCGPINDYAEVMRNPQVVAREMIVDVEHPTLGRLRTLGSPLKMSETPLNAHRRAPLLGEHTDAVLREAGYTELEIEELRQKRAIV